MHVLCVERIFEHITIATLYTASIAYTIKASDMGSTAVGVEISTSQLPVNGKKPLVLLDKEFMRGISAGTLHVLPRTSVFFFTFFSAAML